MNKSAYRRYSRDDQRMLATWAADCAKRVLPLYEKAYPADDRPRRAINMCRTWVRTGVFKMVEIRGASLGAHAAAREAIENNAACFAARAAGQAVGTAHFPQHAYGSAFYALKAIVANDSNRAEFKGAREREWQARRLPSNLRRQFLRWITIQKDASGIVVKLRKGRGF